ncbi:MAG TPA: hypothetical protein VGJ84_08920 [Polyangiaceae bacterium]
MPRQQMQSVSDFLTPVTPLPPDEAHACSNLEGDSRPPSGIVNDGRARTARLTGLVIQAAIAAGNLRDAKDVLREHLDGLLADARGRRYVSPEAIEAAVQSACQVSRALQDSQWLEAAVELLDAFALPFSDHAAAALLETIPVLERFDVSLLQRYASTVEALPTSFEKLRARQRIEELLHRAAGKSVYWDQDTGLSSTTE